MYWLALAFSLLVGDPSGAAFFSYKVGTGSSTTTLTRATSPQTPEMKQSEGTVNIPPK